mgnify:CR=1 FL=1
MPLSSFSSWLSPRSVLAGATTLMLALAPGCDDGAGDGGEPDAGEPDVAAAGFDCDGSDAADHDLCTQWMGNATERSAVMRDGSDGILVNVQSVTVDGTHMRVQATGIPNYQHTITADDMAFLRDRPNAASDFTDGSTTVSEGDVVEFGEDIGYVSNRDCPTGEGYGFWPPGPECPTDFAHDVKFPLSPTPATETCYTGLGTMGLFVNGVSLFTWSDGQSYDNEGVFHNLAMVAEIYDVDLCGGHAAQGEYHHHGLPNCLMEQLGDDGSTDSPILGFVADGYAIYGPTENGTEVSSCWKVRDYADPASDTGCGMANVRSCVLNDPFDVSAGTSPASSSGPMTTDTVQTLSGNTIVAEAGLYAEDYYFDPACADEGDDKLDEHNGHDHGDGKGYHYHVTSTFPYNIGPTFAGALDDDSLARCSDSFAPAGMGGGPPGGGPPGGP